MSGTAGSRQVEDSALFQSPASLRRLLPAVYELTEIFDFCPSHPPGGGASCGKFSIMKRILLKLLLVAWLLPLAAMAGDPAFNGRWRLDVARSTALDGWSTLDLVIQTDGSKVSLLHDLTWHSTKATATNVIDTTAPAEVGNFFRLDQRHMAVYARPKEAAHVTATWIDGGRTLRVEALVPVETSQGNTTLRLYDEYRLLEGGSDLVLIELHNTRSRPLVYRFTKVPAEAAKK